MARKASEHVYGPHAGKLIGGHRSYRVVRVDDRGARSSCSFTGADALERATAYVTKERQALAGRKVSEAIASYLDELRERGNRPSGIESTEHRLRTFFQIGTGNGGLLTAITAARAMALLEDAKVRRREVWIRGGRMKRKKIGRRTVETPRSVTYRAGMLAEAQSFWTWCGEQGWLDKTQRDALDGLKVKGRRKRGKPQMRVEDVPTWERVALAEADKGNVRAFAAVLTFYLGDRSGETLELTAGDVDRGGREVLIARSKTEAGEGRRVEVPEHLRDRLVALRAGRPLDAPLFPGINTDMLCREVRRLCKLAGVRSMTTQGLRGLHATIAREIGMSGAAIARQLGHADSGQTADAHYAAPGARQRGDARRVAATIGTIN